MGGVMAGFVFDLTGIEAALKDWVELLDELREDGRLGSSTTDLIGPGYEPASWDMVSHATSSGWSFLAHNAAMCAFVHQYIDVLTASRDEYLRSDEASRDMFARR